MTAPDDRKAEPPHEAELRGDPGEGPGGLDGPAQDPPNDRKAEGPGGPDQPARNSTPLHVIRLDRAFGPVVEGEAVVSEEGFSPRYDLDRWSGVITKPGHRLEGVSIKDRICFFPTAKGGIAAGWAFNDIRAKGIAPRAFVFGVTNPVMVQGAVLAGIPITEGWSEDPRRVLRTGDLVRLDPARWVVELLRRGTA